MGCSTCKSKRKGNKKTSGVKYENVNPTETNDNIETNNITENVLRGLGDITPQSIGVKLITFCALFVAIPLFALYILGYIFTLFFFTKSGKGNTLSFNGIFKFITYPTRKWKSFRGNLREKSRQREFTKTISYDNMSEINVFVGDKKKEENRIAEEELKGIELVLTDKPDNNND